MARSRQIPEQIKHPTPLYAVVGAGDFVVGRIRRADVEGEKASLQAQVRSLPNRAQTRATDRLNAVISDVLAIPRQVRALPDKAQAGVQSAVDQASDTYGDLAKRGEDLVARVRRQKSTQDLQKQTKSTVSQAKGTATTAKKSASSTKSGAKSTATTARRSAKKAADNTTSSAKGTATTARKATKATTTRAKATATSAQHTAETAVKAASDAGDKVGD